MRGCAGGAGGGFQPAQGQNWPDLPGSHSPRNGSLRGRTGRLIEGDAQEWLAHADGDLHYARLGQKDAEALESLIVFHAQQAIEKALKAVLVEHEVDFPRTHDLEQLVEVIEAAGIAWPAVLNDCDGGEGFGVGEAAGGRPAGGRLMNVKQGAGFL